MDFKSLNGRFIKVLIGWAKLDTHFNVDAGARMRLWVFYSEISSVISFALTIMKLIASLLTDGSSSLEPSKFDIITLDYSPCTGTVEVAIQSLIAVCFVVPITWRYYFNTHLPVNEQKKGLREKREAHKFMQFIMGGPMEEPIDELTPQQVYIQNGVNNWYELVFSKDPMTKLYGQRRLTDTPLLDTHKPPSISRRVPKSTIAVPIRKHNYEASDDEQRWRYIINHMWCYIAMGLWFNAGVVAVIIFALLQIVSGCVRYVRRGASILVFLQVYGALEQLHANMLVIIVFPIGNLFVTASYADLRYKIEPIKKELYLLHDLYSRGDPRDSDKIAAIDVQYLQLRSWAYFDDMKVHDRYVSKHSVACLFSFVLNTTSAMSFLRVPSLIVAFAAILGVVLNFVYFSWAYLLSWDLERQTTHLYPKIMSIVARDPNINSRKLWQKFLRVFFSPDSVRTFTFDKQYALNFSNYSRAVCLVFTVTLFLNAVFKWRV